MQTKVCSKCGEEKELTEFYKAKNGKFGVQAYCKICRRNYNKAYYKENQEERREYNRNWRKENPDYRKQQYQNNREAELKKQKQRDQKNAKHRKHYKREKYQSDPQFRVALCIRQRTYQLVQSGKAKKFCGYNDYIGCTPQELIQHLESQFHNCPSTSVSMTWDNHGEWHIDHIRPLASFDLTNEEEFMQAHHYTNLQPLWAKENLSKGATWDEQET